MASHRAAAALLAIASLLVAVALSGADARPAVRPDKMKLPVPQPDDTESHGPGYVAGAAVPDDELKPECEDDDDGGGHSHGTGYTDPNEEPVLPGNSNNNLDDNKPGKNNGLELPTEPPYPSTNSEESQLDQELCSDCEEAKPKPEPPCSTCESDPKPEPELTCNKVHAVQEGETCYSVGQCAGLGQDDFLRFNPNICCDNLFVGQWVCLDATCAD